MKTFKIQDGDLVFDGQNNLIIIEENDEEAQAIERILTTNNGEWFLNIEHGLNFNNIQGKGKDIESIKIAIIEAIYQEERVEEVENIEINIERKKRNIEVYFRVRMKSGNVIERSEVIV